MQIGDRVFFVADAFMVRNIQKNIEAGVPISPYTEGELVVATVVKVLPDGLVNIRLHLDGMAPDPWLQKVPLKLQMQATGGSCFIPSMIALINSTLVGA